MNQHYVPRVYLRPFTYDGSHLYVYDKPTDKLLPKKWSSLNSTASEGNFYTLPEYLTISGDVHEVETWLQGIDSGFFALREEVENCINAGKVINTKLRDKLSIYLSVQMVRTKTYREVMKEMYKIGIEQLEQDGQSLVRPTPEQEIAFHANHMRRDMAPIIAQHLASRLWFIGVNHTRTLFYTSDSPLVLQEHYRSGTRMGDAIAFPITPHLLLTMYDGEITNNLRAFPYPFYVLNNNAVKSFNEMQLFQCHLRVYSQTDHLTECQSLCALNPLLRSSDSPKRAAHMLMNSQGAAEVQRHFHEMRCGGSRF